MYISPDTVPGSPCQGPRTNTRTLSEVVGAGWVTTSSIRRGGSSVVLTTLWGRIRTHRAHTNPWFES